MGLPLYVTSFFSFAVFSILSLLCILSVFIIICLGCVFFCGPDGLVFYKPTEPGGPPFLKVGEVFSYYAIE
jgi:hypothetical protein